MTIEKDILRMEDVRHHLRLSKTDFSEKLGVSSSYYSQILSGKKGLSQQKRMALFELFSVNLTWLSTGEGEMFISDQVVASEKHMALHDNGPATEYSSENSPSRSGSPPGHSSGSAALIDIIDRQSRQVSDLLAENNRLRDQIATLKKKK